MASYQSLSSLIFIIRGNLKVKYVGYYSLTTSSPALTSITTDLLGSIIYASGRSLNYGAHFPKYEGGLLGSYKLQLSWSFDRIELSSSIEYPVPTFANGITTGLSFCSFDTIPTKNTLMWSCHWLEMPVRFFSPKYPPIISRSSVSPIESMYSLLSLTQRVERRLG